MKKHQSPEYRAWINMKTRCFNPKTPGWELYGGRGITVHPSWVGSFDAFLEHVGPRPSAKHSLDRYPDQNGNYEPGNVRWATKIEQQRNLTNNRFVTYGGQRMLLLEAVAISGLNYNTVLYRLKRGWLETEAFMPLRR